MMTRTSRSLLPRVIALISLAPGCANERESEGAGRDSLPRDSTTTALGDMRWTVLALRDRPVLRGSRITMEAKPTSLGGYGGCNWYGGDVTFTGATLKAAPMTRTLRACLEPEGVSEQEDTYLQSLEHAVTFQRTGDTLRLLDRAGGVLVTFHGQAPLKMRPEDLENSRWTLSDWTGPRRAARSALRARMTLELAEGRIKGFAGCRHFTGSYRADGDVIHFPTLSMVEMDCGNAVMLELEGSFTTALSESSTYHVDKGRRLALHTPAGDTLIFTPAP